MTDAPADTADPTDGLPDAPDEGPVDEAPDAPPTPKAWP